MIDRLGEVCKFVTLETGLVEWNHRNKFYRQSATRMLATHAIEAGLKSALITVETYYLDSDEFGDVSLFTASSPLAVSRKVN